MPRLVLSLVVLALILGLQVVPVMASCTTHTSMYNGRMIMCTTCCAGSNCTTNCF